MDRRAVAALQVNDDRGQCVIGGQWSPPADVLQVERHAIGHPDTRLYRSAIAHAREKLAVRLPYANLNHVGSRGIPTDRGGSHGGAARDQYGIGTRSHGGPKRWTGRVDGRCADIADERIRAGVLEILNVEADICGVIDGNLHRGIAFQEIPPDDVSLDPGRHKQAVRIPYNGVVLNDVVVGSNILQSDSKIVTLGCISIST